MPAGLKDIAAYFVPLRAYNITGIENVRNLLVKDSLFVSGNTLNAADIPTLRKVIDDLDTSGKKVIFTMGKGGVGKTTIAASIALGLSSRGKKVHLTTTDPAAHLKFVMDETSGITMSHIDEKEEWDFESADEYCYAVGQLMNTYLSLSKSANKNLSFINPLLQTTSNEMIKRTVLQMFKKYSYAITDTDYRIKNLF